MRPIKYTGATKYCYPDSEILINKLDIRDLELLNEAEAALSAQRLLELEKRPVNGCFNFEHLKEIHRYILQDLYDFAGKVRNEDISKGHTSFAKWKYIEENADKLFSDLKAEMSLKGTSKIVFAQRAAYYMAELNVLHPFRDGNGRAIREFIRELALINGHRLTWYAVDYQEILDASIRSVFELNMLTNVIFQAIQA